MTTTKTQDYVNSARAALPGGWAGDFFLPEEMTFIATHGEGSHVFDVDGRRFLDLTIGGGTVILGHGNPAVSEAVKEQVGKGTHFYGINARAIELANQVVAASPCSDLIKFATTGSEATFYCLRLARAYTGKQKIMKFEGAYQGHNDYALMSTTPPLSNEPPAPKPDSAGIPDAIRDLVLVAPYNDADAACKMIEDNKDELAAVIVEPFQRALPPKPGFLERLRETTKKCNVVLAFDEVVTGFRLAYGGAQEFYGVIPDVAAYGKAIASGYPLSAVGGREDIMMQANPAKKGTPEYVYISGTLAGNILSATASLATLAELRKPGVYEKLHSLGKKFREGLATVFKEAGIPTQVTGEGPMFQAFFTKDPVYDYRSQKRADADRFDRFTRKMFAQGVYMSRRAKNYISTAHNEADLDEFLTAARKVVKAGF